MNFLQRKIIHYAEAHSTPLSQVLYELERETYLKTLAPQMMSGHIQGQLLSFISQMIQPKNILEIGTFTGYSTICLTKGLQKDGRVHTIEVNDELAYISNKHFAKANLENKIQAHNGKAEDIIPTIDLQFDIVFIDAGKKDYGKHYDLVFDKVNSGGYILADNVLWDGKVVQEKKDYGAKALDIFNKKIQQDERVENVLLPMRDGLMLIRKK